MNWRFVLFLSSRYLLSWKKQSVIIVAVIAGATFLFALTCSLLRGLEYATLDRALGLTVPHVEVEVQSSEYERLASLLKSDERVEAFSPRLICDALLVASRKAKAVRAVCVKAELERATSSVSKYVTNGSWLVSRNCCVVGLGIARELKLKVGSKVTVLLPSGAEWTVRVAGVLNTGVSEIDSHVVYLDLSEALSKLQGKSVAYHVAVKLKEVKKASEVANNLASKGFKAKPWEELARNILQLLEVERFYSNSLLCCVLVISGLGIVNVMLMLTEARKRYIGILEAIGATSGEILAVYFVIALIYGVLGYLAGVSLSLLAVQFLREVSVELLSEKLAVPFVVDLNLLLFSWLYAVAISAFSCAYSAYRASTVKPAEVIRFE